MQGGTALNIVPNLCEIDFEIRNIAQDDPAQILTSIAADAEAIVRAHHNRFPEARIEILEISGYPGLHTPEDAPIVDLLRRISGDDRDTIKVAFGTEGGLFEQGLGLPTVICGPGHMDQGHKPDEFVSIAQLESCDGMLERLIKEIS